MATSTVPVLMSTLVALFTASPAFADTQVLYGEQPATAQRENLCMSGRVTYPEEVWAELGARSRRERYGLDGFVQVRVPGATPQEALEDAWALCAGVETVLRQLMQPGDNTLYNATTAAFPDQTVQIENVEFRPKPGAAGSPFPSDEGTGYQVDFDVWVTARI